MVHWRQQNMQHGEAVTVVTFRSLNVNFRNRADQGLTPREAVPSLVLDLEPSAGNDSNNTLIWTLQWASGNCGNYNDSRIQAWSNWGIKQKWNREAAVTREAISNDGNNTLIWTTAIGEANTVAATTHQFEHGNEPTLSSPPGCPPPLS